MSVERRKWERENARRAVSDGRKARAGTVRKIVANYVAKHGPEPSDEFVSMALGCSVEKVRRYRAKADE